MLGHKESLLSKMSTSQSIVVLLGKGGTFIDVSERNATAT
jgi:hypothetical protein